LTDRKTLLAEVLPVLKKRYGREMKSSLHYSSPWELLVATMLSAQAQDSQVNRATKALFRRYPSVGDYIDLTPRQLYPYIGSIGLYRSKARNLIRTARLLALDFDSKVPRTIKQLVTLPGVGRKTANVVIFNAYGANEGIAVDTHCITVSNRLRLSRGANAEKIERDLMRIAPRGEWGNINHLFIALGRDTCTARRKFCDRCVLSRICPSSDAK
jgi:endonuclease-3